MEPLSATNQRGLDFLSGSFLPESLVDIFQVAKRLSFHIQKKVTKENAGLIGGPARFDMHHQQTCIGIHSCLLLKGFRNLDGLHNHADIRPCDVPGRGNFFGDA